MARKTAAQMIARRNGAQLVHRQVAAAVAREYRSSSLETEAWLMYRRGGAADTPRQAFSLGYRLGLEAVMKELRLRAGNVEGA